MTAQRYCPSRPEFGLLGIDRVTSLTPIHAEAVRNVPATLGIFDSHFPKLPVLPGVVILGCLVQVCELMATADGEPDWSVASAERIRYRHFVQPGDQLELVVDRVRRADGEAVYRGSALVSEKVVTTVRSIVLRPTSRPTSRPRSRT